MQPRTVVYLREPNAEKMAFFRAVADEAGEGLPLSNVSVSLRGYPETAQRARECLARAKKQPKGAIGRALKLAFLKGRYNWARRFFEKNPGAIAMCWQGLTGTRRAFVEGARDAGADRLFAELAPFAGYRTLDPQGVNAESSVIRDRKAYDDVVADADLLDRIKSHFTARTPRRKDVGQGAATSEALGDYLFVPLQVPDDSQMVLFAGWVGGLEGFIDALAKASALLPGGWHLRLKEHPSSKVALTERIEGHIAQGARLVLDNQTDSFAQVDQSKGVLTVNSSMGLQAMFWDKPVIYTGDVFWGIDGLAAAAPDESTLSALLSRPQDLTFDGAFRRRFLTWLARDYYIGFDGKKLMTTGCLSNVLPRK